MKKKNIIRTIIFAAGLVFLTAGLAQGDYRTTWNKAIRVCLECIGIG